MGLQFILTAQSFVENYLTRKQGHWDIDWYSLYQLALEATCFLLCSYSNLHLVILLMSSCGMQALGIYVFVKHNDATVNVN